MTVRDVSPSAARADDHGRKEARRPVTKRVRRGMRTGVCPGFPYAGMMRAREKSRPARDAVGAGRMRRVAKKQLHGAVTARPRRGGMRARDGWGGAKCGEAIRAMAVSAML